MKRQKIVIIGGGFGGLEVAKALKNAPIEVTLIDKTNHHLFQPLLYEVATAALSPSDIAVPLRQILAHQHNATVIMGEVLSINKADKFVKLDNGDHLPFDILVVAIGARHSYFGHDHWEPFAPGLKTLQDARHLCRSILISFEKAERMGNVKEAQKYLNFVVVGGGPTGVELAGAIAEIAYKTMLRNFRRANINASNVFLVEALPRLLTAYPEKLSARAKHDLEKLGVKVLLNHRVNQITRHGVQIENEFIETETVIWAAGNQAPKLLQTLHCPLDKQGRVIVGHDLTIPDHPHIFVIGDAAHTIGEHNQPLPGIATVAVQQGRYVGKLIKKRTPPHERPAFHYFTKGIMATIGKGKCVACIGSSIRLTGWLAWFMWAIVHLMYLVGFRNRLLVSLKWILSSFKHTRGARLIESINEP